MPLYEYRCKECQEVSEFIMKMSDPDPESCPKCGKEPMQKILSTTAFHLKGGGWYNHGYDGKSNEKPQSKDGKSEPKKDASGSKKEGSAPAKAAAPSKSSD